MGLVIASSIISAIITMLILWRNYKNKSGPIIFGREIILILIPIFVGMAFSGNYSEIVFGRFLELKQFNEILNKPIEINFNKLEENEIYSPIEPFEDLGFLNPNKTYKLTGIEIKTIFWFLGSSKIEQNEAEINMQLNFLLSYVVLFDKDSTLLGFYKYQEFLYSKEPVGSSPRTLNMINNDNYKNIPGFIPKEKVLVIGTTNFHAIEKMDSMKVRDLPVIDKNDKFIGFIKQADLHYTLLKDLLIRLQAGNSK